MEDRAGRRRLRSRAARQARHSADRDLRSWNRKPARQWLRVSSDTTMMPSARIACDRGKRRIIAADLAGGGDGMIAEKQVMDRSRPAPRSSPASAADAWTTRRPRRLRSDPQAATRAGATPKLRSGTGRRRSSVSVPGTASGGRRSFHELENSVIVSWVPACRARAAAIWCAYSPTPVRFRSAGR